jgi:lysozyme
MSVSPHGAELIRAYELLRLKAYLDKAGVPTIGWGHTGSDVTHAHVTSGRTITEEEAEALFHADVAVREIGVRKFVHVPLTQGQFDALVSLVFNIGLGNFAGSTLLERLNAHDLRGVARQFPRWCHVKGKYDEDLAERRGSELYTFCGGL